MEATVLLDPRTSSSTVTKDVIQESDSLGRNYKWQQNNAVWLGSFKFPIVKFHSDKYYLSEPPIFVQVEPCSDGYLVADDDVDRHGIGRTLEGALVDYEETLLGYFESLNEHYPKLSRKLKEDLEFLNQKVKRT